MKDRDSFGPKTLPLLSTLMPNKGHFSFSFFFLFTFTFFFFCFDYMLKNRIPLQDSHQLL